MVAQQPNSTVVSEYRKDDKKGKRAEHYQSEADLEKAFIKQLTEQAYDYVEITSEDALIQNLRQAIRNC